MLGGHQEGNASLDLQVRRVCAWRCALVQIQCAIGAASAVRPVKLVSRQESCRIMERFVDREGGWGRLEVQRDSKRKFLPIDGKRRLAFENNLDLTVFW